MATKQRVSFWQRLGQILGFARQKEKLPYSLKTELLSAGEISFYHILKAIAGPSVTICPKVRLTDVFSVQSGKGWQSNWNRISQKHVDFLLCDAATMTLLMAVELDDKSHKRADREARDELVNRVFDDAGLPLLHFPAKGSYRTDDIAAQIVPCLRRNQPITAVNPVQPVASVEGGAPCCPKCGKPMVIRTAKSGARAGEQFYACSGYPQCKTILNIPQMAGIQQ